MLDQFVEINAWAVLVGIAALQLYLGLVGGRSRPYDEGTVRVVQYAIGLPTLAGLAAFLIDPDLAQFALVRLPTMTRVGGVALFDVSALLIFWAHACLGRFWSADLETKSSHVLVESGPYRLVRHPLYSAFFGLTGGLFMMSGNWLVALPMGAYFCAVAARASVEERMLIERLGAAYVSYMGRTGRFLPRLTFSSSPDVSRQGS
jgi:protein-S-isoprenylcysteine O-methyltransferase Ste14